MARAGSATWGAGARTGAGTRATRSLRATGAARPHRWAGRSAPGRTGTVAVVGEEQRGHPVAAGGHHAVVVGLHLVVGGGVGWRQVDDAPGRGRVRPAGAGPRRARAACGPRRAAPGRPARTSGRGRRCSCGAAARRFASSTSRTTTRAPTGASCPPPVDLLEAEEPPVDREAELIAHVAHPHRGLVGERTHHVEVEVDGGGPRGWSVELLRHVTR
jgi:hypothetical protein